MGQGIPPCKNPTARSGSAGAGTEQPDPGYPSLITAEQLQGRRHGLHHFNPVQRSKQFRGFSAGICTFFANRQESMSLPTAGASSGDRAFISRSVRSISRHRVSDRPFSQDVYILSLLCIFICSPTAPQSSIFHTVAFGRGPHEPVNAVINMIPSRSQPVHSPPAAVCFSKRTASYPASAA